MITQTQAGTEKVASKRNPTLLEGFSQIIRKPFCSPQKYHHDDINRVVFGFARANRPLAGFRRGGCLWLLCPSHPDGRVTPSQPGLLHNGVTHRAEDTFCSLSLTLSLSLSLSALPPFPPALSVKRENETKHSDSSGAEI